MRELKFRAWTQTGRMMQWDELQELRIHTLFKMCQPEIKLMQFTGLKDKSGKEIYEGDIIKLFYSNWLDKTETVRWGVHGFGYGSEFVYSSFYCLEADIGASELRYAISVIGNTYENPELLEQSS